MAAQRDPDATRQALLTAAFHEIYRNGFQAASLDRILSKAGVTKGALYHHFGSKQHLGYAVVDEVIRPRFLESWLRLMRSAEDPIDALIEGISNGPPQGHDPQLGCPINNLSQEMSPLDEGFRKRLEGIYRDWRDGIAGVLRRGQETGKVRPEIDPFECADFVVSAVTGGLSLAKTAQDRKLLESCKHGLTAYLNTLRTAPHLEKV